MKKKSRTPSKTIKTDFSVNTLHAMHCGGACILKLHMKDGQISKITSAGDILREESFKEDESVSVIQRRACLLGLSEKKRIYAPDRLKHPLIQTGERGDLKGFKRISWEQALDTAVEWYSEMIEREKELGYLPILEEGGISRFIGPHINKFGNPSSGNTQAASFAAIGEYSQLKGNPVMDMYNSNYIVLWANDTQSNYPSFSFIMMKAKEAGIPITVVDTRNTDTVAAMATGNGEVPRQICVRPGTDGALLAAICFVIYSKGLHDETFLKEYCFGFYKHERVISKSKKLNPITNQPYMGEEFSVPEGQSFEEYLKELGRRHGGYDGVLKWAQELTGTPAELIEKFAIKYALAKPVFLFTKFTGAQRTSGGMYFTWMLIALSAMTGNINKRGGGFGEVRFDNGYSIELDEQQREIFDEEYQPILISMSKIADVLLTGNDGRTKEQLRQDVLDMNGIDLGENAKIKLEMFVRGKGIGNILNSAANVNKNLMVWKNFKHVLAYERFMTTTAAHADLVLPTVTDFEQRYFSDQLMSDKFVVNGPLDHLYEAKTDDWINEQIAQRLGINYKLT